MNKPDFLDKFSYSEGDDSYLNEVKGHLVTWGGAKVEIVGKLRTKNSPLFLAIVHLTEYDLSVKYTYSGKSVGFTNSDFDLYVDKSNSIWVNIGLDENNQYISTVYESKSEADKNVDEYFIDTIEVKVPLKKPCQKASKP